MISTFRRKLTCVSRVCFLLRKQRCSLHKFDYPAITIDWSGAGSAKVAKEVVIAACGVSDKYPQGKSAGMVRAIEGLETLTSFPASGLRGKAVWIIDDAAASKLSPAYTAK